MNSMIDIKENFNFDLGVKRLIVFPLFFPSMFISFFNAFLLSFLYLGHLNTVIHA